jgi:hypothetical protein
MYDAADEIYGEMPTRSEPLPVEDSKALVIGSDKPVQFGNCTLTRTGLVVDGQLTFEDWQELGGILKNVNQSLQWLIGDWINYGADSWGKNYDEMSELTGLEKRSIYDIAYVCRSVHFSVRTELSFAHHKLVASFDNLKMQKQWLEYATEDNLTVSQMRQAINAQRQLPGKTKPTPLDAFTGDTTKYAERNLKRAQKAPRHERMQMAEMLRRLAETIEGLE